MPLLEVADLSVSFRGPEALVPAVRGVSFAVDHGEIVGIVGESGSGKTVTSLALMGLLDPQSAQLDGSAALEGVELLGAASRTLRGIRGRRIGMIFQEPMTALDPVFTAGSQIAATVLSHEEISRRDAKRRAIDMLGEVGIPDPASRYDSYPHELSGGMRQRAMIAMALICRPGLLIADEPTTAVDVTVQAQLLDLLKRLAESQGTAVLLITHDIGVVAEVCDRMVTMYAGEIVEEGRVDDVLTRPAHPYTIGLLEALPTSAEPGSRIPVIPGRVPAAGDAITGCIFHPRCRYVLDRCREEAPDLGEHAPARKARCWRSEELTAR